MSLFADLTFRALIVAVDDFGRYEADPLMLKAALFPRRSDVTPEMVRGWVEELAWEGCVVIYSVEGVEYLELAGWESHRSNGRRAAKSKFPASSLGIHIFPRKSEEIPDGPAHVSEIRPSDVLRLASDEYRVASSEPEAPAEPGAALPPWGSLPNLLGPHGAHPKPEPDERMAWLEAFWPEIVAATDAELPDDATQKQRGAARARIALARWRVYLGGERAYREAGELARIRAKSAKRDAEIRASPQTVYPVDESLIRRGEINT